jgi:hypothetical protein
MLRNIALFAAASVLPLAAVSAQDAAAPATQTPADVPADDATATDEAAPADTTAPAGDTTDTTQSATSPAAGNDPIVAAAAADFSAGATVRDPQGGEVGKVESATATDAIVSTGTNRVQLPVGSFGKNSAGLVIGLTKAQLDAQAAAAAPKTGTPQ